MNPAQAIEQLNACGMTEAAIGAAVDARQSTVNRIRKGADPHWSLGQRLIALATRQAKRRKK